MAEKDYAEIILDAIKTVVDKKIETLAFDKTIKAIITDASRAFEGIYTVSTGTSKFTAYSSETEYKENDTVMVTIPEGNYDNQKIITGKWVDNTNTPLVFKSPLQRIVNVTNNIIDGDQGTKDLFANAKTLREKVSDDSDVYSDEKRVWHTENLNKIYNTGFSRIGLRFEVSTWLREYLTTSGNYGVKLILTFKHPDQDDTFIKELIFDSDEFFGDVYNFESFYTQECIFDISSFEDFIVQGIELKLYQNNNFLNVDGVDIYTDMDGSYLNIMPNIFIKDPYICLGMDADTFDKDSATLVCENSSFYDQSQQATNNLKIIGLRWIHHDEDRDVIQTVTPDTFDTNKYEIRWYRYKLGKPSPDKFAAAHWMRLTSANDSADAWGEWYNSKSLDNITNSLELSFHPNVYNQEERVKAIVLNKDTDSLVAESNIIIFTNKDNVRSQTENIDLNALSIRFDDEEKGQYFIYNRAGEVGKNEDKEIRTLTAVFDPDVFSIGEKAVLKADECSTVEWQIPYGNDTMIIPGIGSGINATPMAYQNQQENGYYTPEGKPQSVTFFIKKTLNRTASRNMVKLKIVRDGQEYAAQVTMLFGSAGTSGSDYTLFVEWENNENAVVYNDTTKGITGYVHLMDSSGQLVEIPTTSDIELSWYKYWNGSKSNNLGKKKASTDYYWPYPDTSPDKLVAGNGISDLYSGNYWINSNIKDVIYFNLETKQFDSTQPSKYVRLAKTSTEKNAIDFKPIDIVMETDDTNDQGKISKITWNNTSKIYYYYSTTKKAFIKYNDIYILDPFNTYDESLTYYYPIDVNETDNVNRNDKYLTYKKDTNNKFKFSIKSNDNNSIKGLYILEVKLKNFGNYDLIAYYPIPVKNNNTIKGLKGPTSVRYSTAGEVDYDRNPFELVISGNSVSGNWELIASDTSNNTANILPRLILNGEEKKVNVSVTGHPYLMPVGTYYKEAPLYGVQFINNGTVLFTQPILVYQDNYPSTTLNKWGGKDIEINNDHGTIVASGFAAGRKEADNSFTGVVIGDWSRTDIDATMSKNTGIYGFNKGAMSYALKDDGTAFFGKDGHGRIYFDGNSAQIYSSNWIDWKSAPDIKRNGMLLDIDDGKLLIEKKNDVQIKLQSNSPFFNIKKYDDDDNEYKDLINIGNSEYYLQSSNYDENSAGIKFDLASGKLEGYNFTIKATYTGISSLPTFNSYSFNESTHTITTTSKTYFNNENNKTLVLSSTNGLYPLTIGGNAFKVSWNGIVTANGGTFNDLTVTGAKIENAKINNIEASNIYAKSGTFKGTINATGGSFSGKVTVGNFLIAEKIYISDLGYIGLGGTTTDAIGIYGNESVELNGDYISLNGPTTIDGNCLIYYDTSNAVYISQIVSAVTALYNNVFGVDPGFGA